MGAPFAEVAKRDSRKKPVVVLKAGRTRLGARAASSHTGALAGNDKIYDDVFRQAGVIRARTLRDMLDFARGVPLLPTPATGTRSSRRPWYSRVSWWKWSRRCAVRASS